MIKSLRQLSLKKKFMIFIVLSVLVMGILVYTGIKNRKEEFKHKHNTNSYNTKIISIDNKCTN